MTEEKQIEEMKKCLDDKCIDLELWNDPDRRILAELVVREFGYRKKEWISVDERRSVRHGKSKRRKHHRHTIGGL